MRHLTAEISAALRSFAEDGDVTRLPADGGLRIVCTRLADRHAVSVVRQADVLWVIIDLSRPDALHQLRQLIRSWPLSATLRMPFASPAPGSMELVG